MEIFDLDSTQDIKAQVADLQGSAQPTDCIAVTQVTDFQLLLADVEEGRFDSIEDALHQGFVGFGVTEGAFLSLRMCIALLSWKSAMLLPWPHCLKN